MPQPDLLTRARSAVTVEEECAVIAEAVFKLGDKLPEFNRLVEFVVYVARGELPRSVLLGVVAALVPEGMTAATIWGDAEKASSKVGPNEADAASVPWSRAGSPALALLIAILEASNAE